MVDKKEIKFNKYEKNGAYHWNNISKSIKKHNAFVKARYDLIVNCIPEIKNKKILDVGCGDGVLCYLLARKGGVVFGIDYCSCAIDLAKKKCKEKKTKVNYQVASAYELPFKDNFFDIVISSDVIEHLNNPEKMLYEIKRVLKDNEKAIITTPIKVAGKCYDELHLKEYSASLFESELCKVFNNVKLINTHPLFWLKVYSRKFKILGNKPIFKYIINLLSIYVKINVFMVISDEKSFYNRFALQIGLLVK